MMASLRHNDPLNPQDSDVFRQFDDYPWESDSEFQSGLRAILGPDPEPLRAQHLTRRARCFYYARKYNVSIDFSAYQSWLSRQTTETTLTNGVDMTSMVTVDTSGIPQDTDRSMGLPLQTGIDISDSTASPSAPIAGHPPPGPYPISFSHIVDLITTGQLVPGVKDIPDTVLAGQETHTVVAKRKKPWEKGES